MKQAQIKKDFINLYGSKDNYMKELKNDYCKVQFEFTCFIDGLCKDRTITQKQYNNITLPYYKQRFTK